MSDRQSDVNQTLDNRIGRLFVNSFKDSRRTLYCFSPTIMIATFAIELILAAFLVVRYRVTWFGKVCSFVLILLATFQFAEYRICTTTDPGPIFWPRIGFVLYFVFVPKSITGAICGGNYVVFNTSNDLYRLYGFYYLGFLLLGIWESIERITSLKRSTSTKKILQWLIVGYLSFMAPMGTAYLLFPSTRDAVASIMCGFALLLAFILALKIVPAYHRAHARL